MKNLLCITFLLVEAWTDNSLHSTEARWHIGMSSASHREDPGFKSRQGTIFQNKRLNYYTVVTLIYGG